jgi:hypothetical protein
MYHREENRDKRIATENRKQATLAGTVVERSCHACAFFHSGDEEHEVMLPFMLEGLKNNERVFHIVDPQNRGKRLALLSELPYDISSTRSVEQVEVLSWDDAYLRDGKFDQHAMIDLIQTVLKQGGEAGYDQTRLWANMEWALTGLPGVHDVIEYETRLNHVLPRYDGIVVCTYDLNRFSAHVVMDIMRTHLMVLIGGILHLNPYFVPPDEFLQELACREEEAKPHRASTTQ